MANIAKARIMDARPPGTRSRSPSPRTGPSSTVKAALPVSSLVTPPKAPNSPLMPVDTSPKAECPNEATDSSVVPNGQPPPSVGASTAVIRGKRNARALGVASRRVVTCAEDGRVARMSDVISAPAAGLVVLNSAIRIAVLDRLVE